MALANLAALYCLKMTLFSGLTQVFELDPVKDVMFYTPSRCKSESEFWIKGSAENLAGEAFQNNIFFLHRSLGLTEQRSEWLLRYYSASTVSVSVNGSAVATYYDFGLEPDHQLEIMYRGMYQPIVLKYNLCAPKPNRNKNDFVGSVNQPLRLNETQTVGMSLTLEENETPLTLELETKQRKQGDDWLRKEIEDVSNSSRNALNETKSDIELLKLRHHKILTQNEALQRQMSEMLDQFLSERRQWENSMKKLEQEVLVMKSTAQNNYETLSDRIYKIREDIKNAFKYFFKKPNSDID